MMKRILLLLFLLGLCLIAESQYCVHNTIPKDCMYKGYGQNDWMPLKITTELTERDSIFLPSESHLTLMDIKTRRLYTFDSDAISMHCLVSDLIKRAKHSNLSIFARLINSKYRGDETTRKASFSGFGMGERHLNDKNMRNYYCIVSWSIQKTLSGELLTYNDSIYSVSKNYTDDDVFTIEIQNGASHVVYYTIIAFDTTLNDFHLVFDYPEDFLFIPPNVSLDLLPFTFIDDPKNKYVVVLCDDPINSKMLLTKLQQSITGANYIDSDSFIIPTRIIVL